LILVHPRNGVQVAITSSFLVVVPETNLFERVKPFFGKYMDWAKHEVK